MKRITQEINIPAEIMFTIPEDKSHLSNEELQQFIKEIAHEVVNRFSNERDMSGLGDNEDIDVSLTTWCVDTFTTTEDFVLYSED